MHATWLLMACCMVQQAGTPTEAPAESAARAAADDMGQSVAAELVASALHVPAELGLSGRPVMLVDVITATAGSPRQVEAARAYWQLVEKVAACHLAWDRQRRLEQLEAMLGAEAAGSAMQLELSARRAAATAALEQARVDLIDAQHALAAFLPASDEALPLPANLPHVGTYNTYFEQIYASRPAPLRAKIIHETLPLKRQAIDARASAVQAAHDALDAAVDAWRSGQAPLQMLLSCLDDLERNRTALLAAARYYNEDIAEYALPLAPASMTADSVAAMLIRRPLDAESSVAVGGWNPQGDGVEPATFNAPLEAQPLDAGSNVMSTGEGAATGSGAPTPAGDPQFSPGGQAPEQESTIDIKPPLQIESAEPPPEISPPSVPLDTPAAPVQEDLNSADAASGQQRRVAAFRPLVEVARRAVSEEQPGSPGLAVTAGTALAIDAGLYPALRNLPPEQRTRQLIDLLHWNRELAEVAGQPLPLRSALETSGGADRMTSIAIYWQAREAAARYQAIHEHRAQVDDLAHAVLARSAEPLAAEAMLQVRTWQLTAEAALLEGQAVLLGAQRQLQSALPSSGSEVLPLPDTIPYAGPFTPAAAAPIAAAAPQRLAPLAAALAPLHTLVDSRAEAVVRADEHRADAAVRYQRGESAIDEALGSIGRQTDETLNLLRAVTEYNLRLADYTLASLPASTPAATITQKLGVE